MGSTSFERDVLNVWRSLCVGEILVLRIALWVTLLLAAAATSRADYPPVLVVDSSGYAGAAVTGTNAIDARQYVTGGGVLVLTGSLGGNVAWGPDLNTALNNPSATGAWDGGSTVTLAGHTLAVPQVLVYCTNAVAPATMQGYDNNSHAPICNSQIGSSFGTGIQQSP